MKDGTRVDYLLLKKHEKKYMESSAVRLIKFMRWLMNTLNRYQDKCAIIYNTLSMLLDCFAIIYNTFNMSLDIFAIIYHTFTLDHDQYGGRQKGR